LRQSDSLTPIRQCRDLRLVDGPIRGNLPKLGLDLIQMKCHGQTYVSRAIQLEIGQVIFGFAAGQYKAESGLDGQGVPENQSRYGMGHHASSHLIGVANAAGIGEWPIPFRCHKCRLRLSRRKAHVVEGVDERNRQWPQRS
jgi:hypothetical protein